MPSKNSIKFYYQGGAFHIYSRGSNGGKVFRDDIDKSKFMSLMDRYLDPTLELTNALGHKYPKFNTDIDIASYAFMSTHFHMQIHQITPGRPIEMFMRSLLSSYSVYYSKRHKYSGHLFESVYKASDVDDPEYRVHLSRYIHRNPKYYKNFKYSSYQHILKGTGPAWLKHHHILDNFNTISDYQKFVDEEVDYRSDEYTLKMKKSFLL